MNESVGGGLVSPIDLPPDGDPEFVALRNALRRYQGRILWTGGF